MEELIKTSYNRLVNANNLVGPELRIVDLEQGIFTIDCYDFIMLYMHISQFDLFTIVHLPSKKFRFYFHYNSRKE